MVLRAIYIVGSNPTKCIILAQGSFFLDRGEDTHIFLLKILKLEECPFTENLEIRRVPLY